MEEPTGNTERKPVEKPWNDIYPTGGLMTMDIRETVAKALGALAAENDAAAAAGDWRARLPDANAIVRAINYDGFRIVPFEPSDLEAKAVYAAIIGAMSREGRVKRGGVK